MENKVRFYMENFMHEAIANQISRFYKLFTYNYNSKLFIQKQMIKKYYFMM